MDLREYEQIKFELAEMLRSVQATVAHDRHREQERIRELFSRLAEDRFNLVVVGRFSRGKTSLMNAILGTDRLPTGIRPLTSVITTVAYGSKEQAVIKRIGFHIDEEIPLEALPDYITEKGNSGNVRRIRMAEVQLPAEFLRRGFYFVDTPGLGSPIAANTRTTEEFLPEADALLLVTSYESPLSEEELRALRSAASRRVFVVINKQDLASPVEKADALSYLCEQLQALFGDHAPKVFSVSARDGLEAKQTGDAPRLAASGIPVLENELVRFLIDEKTREFVRQTGERIALLARDLAPRADADRLIEHIGLLSQRSPRSQAGSPIFSVEAGPNSEPQLAACEICGEVNRRLFDFLTKFQYEIIVRPVSRREVAERGGLCSFHTWQYHSVASPHGTCVGYADVLDRWAAALRRLEALFCSANSPGVGALSVRPEACFACAVRAAAESDAVRSIASRLQENRGRSFNFLSALCLPHFRLLLAAIPELEIRRRLILRQAGVLERLSEEMRRYALKHDGLRRYLASEEETNASDRALLMLAGHRTINTPPPDR
jgi:Dynamin family